MASVMPFFLSNFFFFVQFMAFSFAGDTSTTKANTHNSKPLERTAPITEIKNEKAARSFFSEKWKSLDAREAETHFVAEFAGVTYNYNDFSKVQALLTVWQPYVARYDGLYSFSQVKVYFEDADTGNTTQSVEAGWTVDGNGGKPRYYVFYLNTETQQACVNLECDAFQLAAGGQNILNATVAPTSTYGGEQFVTNVTINYEYEDVINSVKAWAVYIQGIRVGYYLESFLGSRVAAVKADIGGGVIFLSKGPGTPHSGTEMGSGHFSGEEFRKAAYVTNMQLYKDNNYPISDARIDPHVTNSDCYDAKIKYSGSYVNYGGPGGKDNRCKNIM